MLIDWFTVAAQIVNFLILIALLKYFLYDRIVRAMDEREKKVSSRLEDAGKKKQEAEEKAKSNLEKEQEIEEQREEMLLQAKQDAEERRKELTQQARKEVEVLRSRWVESVQKERESFVSELRKMAADQVYSVVRKVLKDMADSSLEQSVIEVFLKKIRNMEKQEQKETARVVKKGDGRMLIRSAFEISISSQRKITQILHEHIDDSMEINYETAPSMILGIELKTRGYKIAWNIQEYIGILEEKATEAMERQARDELREKKEKRQTGRQ